MVDAPAEARPATASADRMSLRLTAVVVAAVLALIGGFGLGRITAGTSPAGSAAPAAPDSGAADHTHAPGTAPHSHDGAGGATAGVGAQAAGLAISASGFTLVAENSALRAGTAEQFRFRIDGPDGRPVTTFELAHEKPLHLIVVRRDLTGYQHLHPSMAADGTWSVDLLLPAAGPWRAFADFVAVPAGGAPTAVTLGADLVVAGDYTPAAPATPARSTTVDGYTVAYDGDPQVGATQPLLFQIARAGRPVADLERYLGAYGHLVALRDGDLGYVHVHPEPELAGDAIKFWLAAPSPGRYRMFLDFQVDGAVHTAEFTAVVS